MENETLLKYFPKTKQAKAVQKGKKFVRSEGSDQVHLIQYLNTQYPKILWMFDLAGTSEVIAGYAADFRPRGYKQPDLHLMKPKFGKFSRSLFPEQLHGLYLELKKSDFTLYSSKGKSKGDIKKNEHIETQAKSLLRLRENGYWADFASGFDDAKLKIDAYLKGDFTVLEQKIILKSLGY